MARLHAAYLKKNQPNPEVRRILAIFVVLVLVFVALNGVLKTYSLGKIVGDSTWDGKSPLAVAVTTKPPSVLVFQSEPKRLVLVTLNEALSVAGSVQKPLVSLSSVFESEDSSEVKTKISSAARAPIYHYIKLDPVEEANVENLKNRLKTFASFLTPFKILLSKEYTGTDLTRFDQIKLWWQLKSIRLNQLDLVNAGHLSEDVILPDGQKVLGVDEVSLHNLLGQYLENREVSSSSEIVTVQNASGKVGAGQLAADFATAVGARIDSIETSETLMDKTKIVAEESPTSRYLAKIFNCDITSVPKPKEGEVLILVGRDFAQQYFQ